MMMSVAQEKLVNMLKDTISLMCKNSLDYELELSVEGLLGITVDKKDIMLVNIRESFQSIAQRNVRQEELERNIPETTVSTTMQQVAGERHISGNRLNDYTGIDQTQSSTQPAAIVVKKENCDDEDPEDFIVIKEEIEDGDVVEEEFGVAQNMDDGSMNTYDSSEFSASCSQNFSKEDPPDSGPFIQRPRKKLSRNVKGVFNIARRVQSQSCRGRAATLSSSRHSSRFAKYTVPLKCRYCERTFVSSSGKQMHERRHQGRVVVCEVCRKEFPNKCDLKRHMDVHSNRRVECPSCKNTFKTPDSLRVHRKSSCKAAS